MTEFYPAVPQANILVVDDTPANLRLLCGALTEQGYKARPAAGGHLALLAAQTEPPHLILLDVMMPDLDGFEVCRRLKADPATTAIPVIFMTVLDQPDDKARAFAAGGVDYIIKPLQLPEVLARVNLHLALSRLQQQLKIDNDLLEQRVQARTAQLAAANQQLQAEMERRMRHQQEKERLFDLTRQQSDQLRQLTTLLIESQQHRQQALTDTWQLHIAPYLTLAGDNLCFMQGLLTKNDPTQTLDLLTDYLNRTLALFEHVQTFLREVPAPLPADNQALLNTPLLQLSAREREVLHLLVEGKTNTDIADLLVISAKTVSTHRANIMQKLGAHSLADLLRMSFLVVEA